MPTGPRFDFLISNPGHHLAMSLPVMARLGDTGEAACRVLSLCELRGFSTPVSEIAPHASCRRIVPWRFRKPAQGRGGGTGPPASGRRWARTLAWRAVLAPRLRAALRRRPDLVILPNDAAYPYDLVTALLRRRGIPFLLLQEGIRFPLPTATGAPAYGTGGAQAIAAWGDASAAYFQRLGIPAERIHVVGSPRFDEPIEPRQPRPGRGSLLLLTNPIDDMGFCSRAEKLDLVGRLVHEVAPLFESTELSLTLKPHGREDPDEYRRLLDGLPTGRAGVVHGVPLGELFTAADAAVVLASTVGLEALRHGLPLGVLEIPGHGHQYDYVQSEAALGLSWSAPMAPQVVALLDPTRQRAMRTRTYLRRQLDLRPGAAERVARLARSLVGPER